MFRYHLCILIDCCDVKYNVYALCAACFRKILSFSRRYTTRSQLYLSAQRKETDRKKHCRVELRIRTNIRRAMQREAQSGKGIDLPQ